ncbi:MAG: GNAT family N-acetyltransferase [Gemmatimonadetes bacterium]|nr:GNAT family N-acetyltransferase [Gemmatimonadota bacterium]
MADVTIRDAAEADAVAIAEMVVALNRGLGWETCTFDAATFRRDGVGSERWFDTFVAEADGDLVGYAMFHRSYDTEHASRGSYLTDLYVIPRARGTGAGRRLLSAVAARTRDWGGDVVWWVTTEDNEIGKRFYRRLARHVPGVEIWVAAGEDFDALASG